MIIQGPESEIARLFRETNRQLERIHSQEHGWKTERLLLDAMVLLERIGLYFPPPPPQPTPTSISFQETTMNPTQGGQSQVFTGTLSPAGSTYPAGTTFTVTSNDPAVSPTVDPTGATVSVTYPQGWSESTTTPLVFSYSSSTFVPVAPGTATQIAGTITPSAPPAGSPNSIAFVQTT
jgi:hypothetical protein